MYSEQRRSEIVKIIEKNGSIDVNMLSETFRISRETIRRDLSALARQGVLTRTHGGAVLNEHTREYPVVIRGVRQIDEKKKICQRAALYIREGDTIFVDNSSTLLYLPQYLSPKMKLTILTNSINFILKASKIPNNNWLVICLGGIVNASNLSVHGTSTVKNAEEYYPSKALFSCAGISPDYTVADNSLYEIEVKRMMIERAQKTFLLADHTKLEKAGQIFLCSFSDIDYLITTMQDIQQSRDFLGQADIDIVVAN